MFDEGSEKEISPVQGYFSLDFLSLGGSPAPNRLIRCCFSWALVADFRGGLVDFAPYAGCPDTYPALMVEVSALYLDGMSGFQGVSWGGGIFLDGPRSLGPLPRLSARTEGGMVRRCELLGDEGPCVPQGCRILCLSRDSLLCVGPGGSAWTQLVCQIRPGYVNWDLLIHYWKRRDAKGAAFAECSLQAWESAVVFPVLGRYPPRVGEQGDHHPVFILTPYYTAERGPRLQER